jgi:cytochrome c-type biogenesis protein CcmE
MTPTRKRRLSLIAVLVIGTSIAVGLILKAMNENVMFFFSPTQIKAGEAPKNRPFRIGGMVVMGSVKRSPDSVKVTFDLADSENSVPIVYSGILPDLFREGQGIIANGRLNEKGQLVAEEVLAKHDENYMPPEVADMMKPKTVQTDSATNNKTTTKSQ